jgi:hypothetical protein
MKKIGFLLLFLSAGYFSQAQIAIGLKGGLNFPTVDALGVADGVDISDTEGASGYHVGAFARVKLTKLAIQPEVLYSFQSFDFTQTISGNDVDITQEISYLTVPVMVRLYLLGGLNLQAGPQFGFLLGGDAISNVTGATTRQDITNALKGTDIGLNFGAGIDLPFGLDVHARYILGVSNVNDVPGESNNSQVQVSVGYALFGT